MLLTKTKQQDLLRDGKNISDSIAYLTRVYMICLIFPNVYQLALMGAKGAVRNYRGGRVANDTGRVIMFVL